MEKEIRLKYQLDENELMSAIRAQSMRTWSFRFLVGFILVMYAYVVVQQSVYGATLDVTLSTLAPVLVATLILVIFTFSNPFVRRRIRQEPKYTCEQCWQFAEEAVSWKTHFSESTREWNTYPKVIEDNKYFFLFLRSNSYTPIPKRAFANADEESRFRELLKRKIPTWG